ncbi:hypothetical protein ACFL1X_09560 [Candidatus Hydrogenedentota bacterium]
MLRHFQIAFLLPVVAVANFIAVGVAFGEESPAVDERPVAPTTSESDVVQAPEVAEPPEKTDEQSYAEQVKTIGEEMTPEEAEEKEKFKAELGKSTKKAEEGFVEAIKSYAFFVIVVCVAFTIWKMFYSD